MINQVTGEVAQVRWGYHLAASLRSWVIDKGETGVLSLSARIDSQNAVWVSQHPLVFEARHAKGVWRWPITSLQIVDGLLSATLGPQEVTHRVIENASA